MVQVSHKEEGSYRRRQTEKSTLIQFQVDDNGTHKSYLTKSSALTMADVTSDLVSANIQN
jgi:hypothetical protein